MVGAGAMLTKFCTSVKGPFAHLGPPVPTLTSLLSPMAALPPETLIS